MLYQQGGPSIKIRNNKKSEIIPLKLASRGVEMKFISDLEMNFTEVVGDEVTGDTIDASRLVTDESSIFNSAYS